MEDKQLKISDLTIVNPSYYRHRALPCFDIQEGFATDEHVFPIETYYECNILKYLYRYPWKNGIEDLKKAKRYLEKLIDLYTARADVNGIEIPLEDER